MFFTAGATAHTVIKKVILGQMTLLILISMFFTAGTTAHTVIKKVILDQMTLPIPLTMFFTASAVIRAKPDTFSDQLKVSITKF